MFRIGQKVVCVKALPVQPISEGKDYRIKDISTCEGCNAETIDVGFKADYDPANEIPVSECQVCGGKEFTDIYWFMASRFRPIDEAFGENVAASIEEQFQFITA